MKIKIAKIISVITHYEYGLYKPPAIIMFEKREWLHHTRKIPYDPTVTSSNEYEIVCVQYKYFMRINLWLLEVDFNWSGKLKS